MTKWRALHGEILDLPVDGLVCSGNPSLNLSGGVGGAFLLRYGDAMQSYLHRFLQDQGIKYLEPGKAIVAPPLGSPYKAIAHAVAVDLFYDTNDARILSAYRSAIDGLRNAGCTSIAAACLGCGYGGYPPSRFAAAIEPLVAASIKGLFEFTFVTTDDDLFRSLRILLPQAQIDS